MALIIKISQIPIILQKVFRLLCPPLIDETTEEGHNPPLDTKINKLQNHLPNKSKIL